MQIATSGIILKDRKILLIQRSGRTEAYPHCWACPGGRGEPGESPEQTTVREVKEEVGLDFKPTQLFKKNVFEVFGRRFAGYQFLGDWQGEPRLCEEEVTDCKWFTYDEAVKLRLAFNFRDIIEKLRKESLL